MRFVVAATAAVLLAGGCANLLTPSSQAAAKWAALDKARAAREAGRLQLASNPDAKKICKEMPLMGSNMPKRVCSTQAEWDSYDKAERQRTEDIRQASGNYGTVATQGEAGSAN